MPARPGFRGRYGADGYSLQNPGPQRRGAPRPSPHARPPAQTAPTERAVAGAGLPGQGSPHTACAAPVRSRTPDRDDGSCLPSAMKNILRSSWGVEWGGDHPPRLFAGEGMSGGPKRPRELGIGGAKAERDGGIRRNKAAASGGASSPAAP